MEFSREQKDKILRYLCDKHGIDKFCFGGQFLCFVEKQYNIRYWAFIAETGHTIEKPQDCQEDLHILDVILDISSRGYTITNFYKIIIPAYTSLESLLIEMDLK